MCGDEMVEEENIEMRLHQLTERTSEILAGLSEELERLTMEAMQDVTEEITARTLAELESEGTLRAVTRKDSEIKNGDKLVWSVECVDADGETTTIDLVFFIGLGRYAVMRRSGSVSR
jgi:hypothetical protein